MISKDLFIKMIDYIKKLNESGEKLGEAFSTFEPECKDMNFIFNGVTSNLIEFLSEAMGVKDWSTNGVNYGNDIEYFIYDLEFGTKWTPDSILDENGNPIDISTTEKLYDYIIKENKEKK